MVDIPTVRTVNRKWLFIGQSDGSRKLYKVLDEDPVGDKLLVVDIDANRQVVMPRLHTLDKTEPAFSKQELSRIVGMNVPKLEHRVADLLEYLEKRHTYTSKSGKEMNRIFYTKEDILRVHETVAAIDPRTENKWSRTDFPDPQDRLVKRTDLNTRQQVLEKLNMTTVFYTKDPNTGQMVPVYKLGAGI